MEWEWTERKRPSRMGNNKQNGGAHRLLTFQLSLTFWTRQNTNKFSTKIIIKMTNEPANEKRGSEREVEKKFIGVTILDWERHREAETTTQLEMSAPCSHTQMSNYTLCRSEHSYTYGMQRDRRWPLAVAMDAEIKNEIPAKNRKVIAWRLSHNNLYVFSGRDLCTSCT